MKLNRLEKYFKTVNGEIIDFYQIDRAGLTPLLFALTYNKSENLNLSNEYFDCLIKNSDLNKVDNENWTPLMFVFTYNKSKNLNLTSEQFDYLIKKSDLSKVDNEGWLHLMFYLRFNKIEELNLSSEQLDYLIKNSDLKKVNNNGWSPLIYALNFNKSEDLNKEYWKYMIENSDLSLIQDKDQLIELKKIQSELLNEQIMSKINIELSNTKKIKI